MGLKAIWDRLTGAETDRQVSRATLILDAKERNHAREVRQMRLEALAHGVLLYRETEVWVDVATLGDEQPQRVPATWQWAARTVYGEEIDKVNVTITGRSEVPPDPALTAADEVARELEGCIAMWEGMGHVFPEERAALARYWQARRAA